MKPAKPQSRGQIFTPRDRANIAWFWRGYLRDKAPWMVVVLVLILLQGLVYQQFLRLTEDGLRVIFESGNFGDLVRVCVIVFFLFAARALVSYVSPRLAVWLASNAVMKLRKDMIAHLIGLDLAFFERTKAGDIILKVVNQAQALSVFVGQATVNAVRDTAMVVIISGYLIWKSPILFATALIVMPFIILLMQAVSKRIKAIQSSAEALMAGYISGIEEMINGMRTVKIAGQEEMERTRLTEDTHGLRTLSIKLQAAQALVLPSIDLSSAFVYVLVIGGGGYMALSPAFDVDGAAIITFLIGMALVFDPARLVAGYITKLQTSLVQLDRVRSLFEEQAEITDAPDAVEAFDPTGDIVLKDVRFGYSAEHPLFDGLNMVFEGGKVTAIVGATGSGKTSILSLIARLYTLPGGRITIGGQDITMLKIASLRRAFSVVAQDIVIFNNSIWENIRYVRPDATDDEIWDAARAAAIDDVIRQRGDAPLGPKGNQLSGGQMQRIAIARAFLRSAPILLLDEATSALDQRTEERIKGSLAKLSQGKTTLIVAHRLSTVAHADRIYVMDAGQVAEVGTHEDLMAAGGLYAGMYETQKQSYR